MASFFKNLFHDNNDINEKVVLGFVSFAVMFLFALADLLSGIIGLDLIIHEYIYQSFLILTLGAFGIGSADKYINRKFEFKNAEKSNTSNDTSTDEYGPEEGFNNRNRME